jgi:RNA polymerase sigma-70 factor, ECF subfamily
VEGVLNLWELYDAHQGPLRRFVLSYVRNPSVADDLVNETFLRALEKKEQLADLKKARAWLFRIAANLCMDHFRSGKKEILGGEIFAEPRPAPDLNLEKQSECNEMSLCVQEKLDLIPEQSKTVLILFDVMGFSHKEIAEILDDREGTVKVRLHRARQQLKQVLEQDCTFERDDRDVLICEPKES